MHGQLTTGSRAARTREMIREGDGRKEGDEVEETMWPVEEGKWLASIFFTYFMFLLEQNNGVRTCFCTPTAKTIYYDNKRHLHTLYYQ